MSRETWEYKTEYVGSSICEDSLETVLSDHGEEGWEAWHLKSTYDRDNGRERHTIYFKRKDIN